MPWLALALIALADPPLPTAPFEAPKYGVKAAIPEGWEIVAREEDDRVFVALIPQADPERPGAVACELGLAPETLDEYRTRIDGTAKRGGRPGGKLVAQRGGQGAERGPAGDGLGIPPQVRRPLARAEYPDGRAPADVHLHAQRR